MNDLTGKEILHYKIIRKAGEGGMGVVYKAEDTKLKREVAIKFLPRHVAVSEEERERFKIEAQAAAALNHPNIATIHSIEEVDGDIFIVMEYIEGQELKDVETAYGDTLMPINDIINYIISIAEGLQAAHKKGIVHRDIKSSNIMISDEGQVKIMDFGLAKVRGSRHITKTGTILGTLYYMSPEQIQGEQVDHRTDIWSLGVVLYEMLTGSLPFKEEYDQVAIYSILTDEPERLVRLRKDVPEALEAIVLKMLQKDPDKRYQSVQEMLVDLKALITENGSGISKKRLTPGTLPGRRHPYLYGGLAGFLLILIGFSVLIFTGRDRVIEAVAIMPMVNVGADSGMEYLSDGITESLISNFSRSPNLKVMSRHAVFRYKGKEIDPQAVGQDLKVEAVLTGQVVQRGDDLRLSLELVDTRDSHQLWGAQYNRKLGDILALQEDISRQIYKQLRIELSIAEQEELTKHYTENSEAYQLYLKGRYFWNKFTEEGIKKGMEYFTQAVEKDPNFALAYAGLADCYSGLAYSFMPPREAVPIARAYVLKALELDEGLADAHYAMADIKYHYDWDWPAVETELKRAIELNPNHAFAYELYGRYLLSMGRPQEAIVQLKKALGFDPLSHLTNCYLAGVYYGARQYDHAIEQARKTLEMEAYCPFEYMWIGGAYIEQGMHEEGITELNKTQPHSADWPPVMAGLAYAYAVSGDRAEAQKLLDELSKLAIRRHVDPYLIAVVHTGLGNKDQAFEWLGKAYEERSKEIPSLKVEPKLDDLRSDPRFSALLKKVGWKTE
jgi:serine/threonine-protein kinase